MKRLLTIFTLLATLATPALASGGATPDTPEIVGQIALALGAMFALPTALRAIGVRLPLFLGLLATVITTTALDAAYGTQYKDGSKSVKDLRTKLFETGTFNQLFTTEYTKLTRWEKAVGSSSAMLQRYQKAFTPNGTFTFEPSAYDLDDMKIDGSWVTDDIAHGFLGFLDETNQEPGVQPLTKYLMGLIEKQFPEDLELYAAWSGQRIAVTPGTSGTPGGSMDGFRKVINDGIDAGTIVPIAIGAAPTDSLDYVNWIEEFAAGIPNTDRKTPMKLAVSLAGEDLFMDGMRRKYNTYYRDTEQVNRVYTRKNLEVTGEVAMADTDKVFATPKDNIYQVINLGPSRMPKFHWESVDRTLKTWMDIKMKYTIWHHARFYTNDSDLLALS